MACLNPQRTYFLVTCPRLDPNHGVIARGFAWTSLEATVVVYNSINLLEVVGSLYTDAGKTTMSNFC